MSPSTGGIVVKWYMHFGNQFVSSANMLNIELSWDPKCPLLEIQVTEGDIIYPHRTHMITFTTALIIHDSKTDK